MGAAKDEHLVVLLGGQLLQQAEVDGIGVVFIDQGAADHLTAVVLNGHVEGVVDRGEDDDPIPGLAKGLHSEHQGLHHAVGAHNPLGLNVPVVARFHPGADGFPVFPRGAGVPQNVLVHVCLEPLGDFRGVFKLHIRHGEGHNARREIGFELAHGVPFPAAAVGAVHQGFKIVFHKAELLRCFFGRILPVCKNSMDFSARFVKLCQ